MPLKALSHQWQSGMAKKADVDRSKDHIKVKRRREGGGKMCRVLLYRAVQALT